MNKLIHITLTLLLLSIGVRHHTHAQSQTQQNKPITLILPKQSSSRVHFGAEKLKTILTTQGYTVRVDETGRRSAGNNFIVIGTLHDQLVQKTISTYKLNIDTTKHKEGFTITSFSNNRIIIAGSDDSGVLYGCLALAEKIRASSSLPQNISFSDHPEMVLRGTCVGLQKPFYLPGRTVYEYPYTPETFPWFYDKDLWIRYLDLMVENRLNSLYLWNGHPFASLVKLPDYPYAVEVDEETFKKNEAMFRFLTEEADKRGIWVIQMFYNIIVSKPFAEHHHIKTQDRDRRIVPVIADYTRKSIAAFIEKYPNVGLLITLGEAMQDEDDIDWFTKTIIPGVKDGLNRLGKTEEPPIVLRAHDSDPEAIMKAALPLYKNLYTMAKYNGEALTSYEPRGPWAAMHRHLSELGSVHIDNVHILANLEPFRYGSPDFIQRSVQAMHTVHGANGLHLYPQASYWDWPYTADDTSPRLLQIDRDRIWYEAWARYSWNSKRDREDEIKYWSDVLAMKYGCDEEAGRNILKAYEESGEIAPKLLRRFGITDGNRQTLTLGMFMNQLTDPFKYRVWKDLYDSDGPEGEMLIDYAEKEWKGEKHVGETPVQIIDEVVRHGEEAVDAIEAAARQVTRNKEEFERLKNDMLCYRMLANFYHEKVKAALFVLQYKHGGNVVLLDSAEVHLEKSVDHFRNLAIITKNTYRYANSMQTAQRKIPIGGDDGKNKTWSELLPYYEDELKTFSTNIASLTRGVKGNADHLVQLQNAPVKIMDRSMTRFTVREGEQLFGNATISEVAPELKGLEGVFIEADKQLSAGTSLTFRSKQPVKVLVGFFDSEDKKFLHPPNLETNANANDHGQASVVIRDAMIVEGYPPLNVHAYAFDKGTNTLTLAKGMCVILGFVP